MSNFRADTQRVDMFTSSYTHTKYIIYGSYTHPYWQDIATFSIIKKTRICFVPFFLFKLKLKYTNSLTFQSYPLIFLSAKWFCKGLLIAVLTYFLLHRVCKGHLNF